MDSRLNELLEAAVERLRLKRHTFTDKEALETIWQEGYDVSPQEDTRFVLACEDQQGTRHWRLQSQSLANELLVDALRTEAWDGRDLDTKLAELDARDGVRYVFCPIDPRFILHPDGTLDTADRELNEVLPAAVRATLDAFGPSLLEAWENAGNSPWTVRKVTETLAELGWAEADTRGSERRVRAWLLSWEVVLRVGLDYWVPATYVPQQPVRRRMHVLPVSHGETVGRQASVEHEPAPEAELSETLNSNHFISSMDRPLPQVVRWTMSLKTIHLVEGFVPVPKSARNAYPPRSIGQGEQAVLRGRWFETNESLWLWLDRAADRLYGPELANLLAWREAGERLQIEWAPDVIVLRLVGLDQEVQREETRLVDLEALKNMRGGLGESYRSSLQQILEAAPYGLPFADVVAALRERQSHVVHHGTIRALLSAGSFIQREGRWFASPYPEVGIRRLRAAVVDTLIPAEQIPHHVHVAAYAQLHTIVEAIHSRLEEIIDTLKQDR